MAAVEGSSASQPATSEQKWAQLSDWAQLGIAVADVLSLHQQLEHIQAASTFTAQRQPASRRAQPSTRFALNDDSDAESDVESDCGIASDGDFSSNDSSAGDGDDGDSDYVPSGNEEPCRAPFGERRAFRAAVVATVGRRSLAAKARWVLDPGLRDELTPAPLLSERAQSTMAHTDIPSAPTGPSTRSRRAPAPPVTQERAKLPDASRAVNHDFTPPNHNHGPSNDRTRSARTKGPLGQWLASSQPPTANGSSTHAPTSTIPLADLQPPLALPLANGDKSCSKRRGKGQGRLPRSQQSPDARAHTRARDKERRKRNEAVKASSQKAQVHARAMSPADRALRQMDERAARKVLEKLAPVRSSVKLTKLLSGRSYFIGPSKFRNDQCAREDSGAEHTRLHSNCNRLVRNLVRREGYTYVPNDDAKAQACFDASGKMFAVKARQPQGAWYQESIAVVTRLATDLREALHLADQSPNTARNTRGKFTRFTFGTSFGGGQKKPTRISPDSTEHNERLIVDFLTNKDVQKVLKHVESVVFLFYPKLAKMYRKVQAHIKVPDVLRKAGINLAFAAHTLNLGPYVTCWFHRDARNFILGICPVLVLGSFDHRTSGHFIMVEPRIVMELRPGDLLIMMSAVLTHGNAPLRRGETRLSWTFFTAGGLFRWVAAKCRLVADIPDDEYQDYCAEAERTLLEAWDAIPTFETLQARAKATGLTA